MASSLHVSLPDEMRRYVDHRTNGQKVFSTPSEYVRALIREDMKKGAEKFYVYKTLIQGSAEIDRREFASESEIDAVFNEYK